MDDMGIIVRTNTGRNIIKRPRYTTVLRDNTVVLYGDILVNRSRKPYCHGTRSYNGLV